MVEKLQNLVIIQSGAYATARLNGDVLYLQAKHIRENGELEEFIRPSLYIDDKLKKHLLSDKDILFVSKGSRNNAFLYDKKIGSAVASTTMLVMKIRGNYQSLLLPEYLVWYLNQPNTQNLIKSKAMGSGVPSISITEMKELKIYVPSMEKQKLIVKIAGLMKKEKELNSEIMRLKELYLQYKLIHYKDAKDSKLI